MRKTRGFTLVEALLALGILGSVLLAAQMVLFATLNTQKRLHQAVEPVSQAQSLLWLLQEDLRAVVDPELTAAVFEAVSMKEAVRGDDLLSFITASDPRFHRRGSGLFQVSYRLGQSRHGRGTWDLFRAEVPWHNGPLSVKRYEPVFQDLLSLEFSYSSGAEWTDTWQYPTDCPAGVRIVLAMPPAEDEQIQEYNTLVWIPAGSTVEPKGGAS